MKKDLLNQVEQLLRFREEAMERARQELKDRMDSLRVYTEGEQFERDLDRLALRLKLDTDDYRAFDKEPQSERAHAKARYLFERARKQILRTAEAGGAFALFSRRSQVVLAITLICGGIKGAEILFECYQVFAPALRRRGLHAV